MLPTTKTPPKLSLSDLTVLCYGNNKFGKSTWCSHAESALFLATEAGLNSLEVYQQPISRWEELLAAAKELAEGKHGFKTVIIDTVDNAYRMCAEYINQKFKVEHESDLGYGKGFSLINNEFHRVLNKLALLPYGLFLVSHAQDKEIETRTGKITKVVPTLPDKARKLVLGMVDIILFCDFEPTTGPDGKPAYRRVVRTKPSSAYEAGDRTGRLPAVLDFDFAAFAAAFSRGTASPPAAAASPPGAAASPPTTSPSPLSATDSPTAAASPPATAAPPVAVTESPTTAAPTGSAGSPALPPATRSPPPATSTSKQTPPRTPATSASRTVAAVRR